VITRYEIEPAVGVKGAQIVNLMKDLARACHWYRCGWWKPFRAKPIWAGAAQSKRQIVRLSEIIGSDGYQNMSSRLAIAVGKDIAGQPVYGGSGQDAARAGGGYHWLGQISGHQCDDPVLAVQNRHGKSV
jgi:hypothetical protein